MFRWLRGPGAVFKDPLPGSTNYLSAYDNSGQLVRTLRSDRPQENPSGDEKEGEGNEENAPGSRFGEGGAAGQNIQGDKPIPREQQRDLAPFPLNQQFKSQSVLSDGLREEIWRRVKKQGQSVRRVSADFSVDMRRVGAVVRLKEVEKAWIDQVRCLRSSPVATSRKDERGLSLLNDETTRKYSISLEDLVLRDRLVTNITTL